ncbi:MAG: hypothetical protein H9534_14130 [Dolichospermum circinale Clear-D4]|jgi:hypothetical protein|nr:hypothetical protein [Dolichospermum circinale Clear-D4]
MAITFTDREMQRAWRENSSAYHNHNRVRTNAHRLLLFYAVECGFKAVLMKRKNVNRTDLCPEILEEGHDINGLLEGLYPGNNSLQMWKLPEQLFIQDIQDNSHVKIKQERQLTPDNINQIWRYGGKFILKKDENKRSGRTKITDEDIEKKLLKIVELIQKELQRP